MLCSHGTENLNPISQMRKLRIREAQQVAAACPAQYSHPSLSGSKVCAWKAKYLGLLRVSGMFSLNSVREVGTWGFTLNLGQKRQVTGGDTFWLQKVPRLCCLPLEGWEVSASLSYHVKDESFYFYFAKRGFSIKWMLNVIKCLFIILGFSLLAY